MKLPFPEKILDQHLVALGKTGAGKSSALRVLVEHLLRQGKRVCIVDPKGDWFGLKSSADGKQEGFAVIGFGDFKDPKATDVPINAQSGRHIAELISSGNRPCIIGFRGWMPSQMTKFWIDFASTLFNSINGELYLVIDEVHNFAAKGKIMDPEAGKCLHWTNRLMSEARGLGLICLIASQRPAKVHNDTLTCCETLVAMRVNHPSDREASREWIEGCGDIAQGKEVLNSLAGMARGEAFVWSPEIGYGPQRIKFPMFETFDSFAPPQLQKKVSQSGWANVDLDAVKVKLASVIEEQKANDPAELKRAISGLKKELAQAQLLESNSVKTEAKTIEVPVITEEMKGILKTCLGYIENLNADVKQKLELINGTAHEMKSAFSLALSKLSTAKPALSRADRIYRTVPVTPRRPTPESNGESIGGGLRRMMIALAQRPGLSKRQLGVRAGLSSRGGTFSTYMTRLRTNGWIDNNGTDSFQLTDEGSTALGTYNPLPTGKDLLAYWLNELGGSGAGRMLAVLADCYPSPLTKNELGERADISSVGGTFSTYLTRLRTLELVEGRTEITASKEFFE